MTADRACGARAGATLLRAAVAPGPAVVQCPWQGRRPRGLRLPGARAPGRPGARPRAAIGTGATGCRSRRSSANRGDAVTGVLVLGGYGAFGTRLCQLLARSPELTVHVAGRHLGAAEAACRRLDGGAARAVALDRDLAGDVAQFLRREQPRVVIDAAGPFHGRDYRFPELVALHGAHSIDLADDRAYVTGITALEQRARSLGVLVASGASTVPALSGAVVDHLAEGLDSLDAVDIGISPGNRSPRGRSTVR